MRILLSLALIFALTNCKDSKPAEPIIITSPQEIATSFISAVFEQHNPAIASRRHASETLDSIASSFAMGNLKQTIASTDEAALNQLKKISGFEMSDIKVETKPSTNLSVVSMKTKMTLDGKELNAEQHVVLKLIDNQWMVYHF